MTIKSIKEAYRRYHCTGDEWNSFAVWDYRDGHGKVVIVVTHSVLGRDVVQVVRVSDGAELLAPGRCRPCDNMDDAVDVAAEMMEDQS